MFRQPCYKHQGRNAKSSDLLMEIKSSRRDLHSSVIWLLWGPAGWHSRDESVPGCVPCKEGGLEGVCPNPAAHKLLLISCPELMTTGCITAALVAASAVGMSAPAALRPPKPGMSQPLTCKMLGVLESWADTVRHQPGGRGKRNEVFLLFPAVSV